MWHALSIVYYGDHIVAALQQPLQHCIARLREDLGIDRLMLIPRWKFGPHLDIVVECSEECFTKDVFPRCQQWFGDWMEAHPSTETLDPAAYEAVSMKLALAELESGPFLPLLPNNSVLRSEYHAARALKLPEIAAAKEDFLCATVDFSFSLLAERQRDGDALFLALVAMMAVLGQSYRQGGLSRGYLSFRSHAEYFFAAYDNQDQVLRKRFEILDNKVAQQTMDIVRCVVEDKLDALALPAPLPALLREWQAIVATMAAANDVIIEKNYARMVADDTFDRLAAETANHVPAQLLAQMQERAPSMVAQAMQQEAGQRVLNSPEFLSYRTTVNFFYYLLPLLGISPMKKFCLCLVSANAAERALGVSWERIFGIDKNQGDELVVQH